MSYKYDTSIQYDDDDEYRNCICQVFQMAEYDDTALSAGLDAIFRKTSSNPRFTEVYGIAAGKMMSEDPEFGLAILFSYDYFELFHLCLVDFFTNPTIFTITNIHYLELKNKIY